MKHFFRAPLFLVLISLAAAATTAPKPGEIVGASEYALLLPVGRRASDGAYSEGLRFGGATDRFLPFGFALDFGFLNSQKQRYSQISLFNFGKQPIPADRFDVFYRAELLSLAWAKAGGIWYAPGIEIGVVIPVWQKRAFALSSRATIDRSNQTQPIFIFSLSFIQAMVHKPLAQPPPEAPSSGEQNPLFVDRYALGNARNS